MAIVHDPRDIAPGIEPFIFAELPGLACSVCAPRTVTKEEIEKFANENSPAHLGTWHCIDKAESGLGSRTPNPCNQYLDRQHWFLLSLRAEKGRTTELPMVCPWCGDKHDLASEVSRRGKTPKPGAVALCVNCGEWAVFDENLALRKPTADELTIIGFDSRARMIREAWAQMDAARKRDSQP